MRRSWLMLAVVAYMVTLAAVIQAQSSPPKVLTEEARSKLVEVYKQTQGAAVRIETIPEGTGSGFFISADGLVMTAFHVIGQAKSFSVVTSDQKSYPATVVGYDEHKDLALIKARVSGSVPFLPLETSQPVHVGDPIFNIGNSRGEFISPRYGLVTAIDRTIAVTFPAGLISSTVPLAPGDSGGPIINKDGKVVAVAVAIGRIEGIFESFVAPIAGLGDFVRQLQAGLRVDVPYIGVLLDPVDDEIAQVLSIPKEGVLIRGLIRGGAAEGAGLRGPRSRVENGREVVEADVILKVDGKPFNQREPLQQYIRAKKVGDVVTITLRRGTSILEIPLTLAASPRSF